MSGAWPSSLTELAAACEATTLRDAANAIVKRAVSRAGGYVCFCNVHVLVSAIHDRALNDALSGACGRYPDGAPVAWLRRRISREHADRIGGPDLMPLVLALGREHGVRHYLFGSTPDVLSRLGERLQMEAPGVLIVGALAPPFDTHDFSSAIDSIRSADPHVVWCALGAPKQELWMHMHAPLVSDALFVGVGAAFDFHAGTKPRAPRWMQDNGLEWLHRFGSEPRRLAGRYIKANSEFVARCAIELLTRRLVR